MSDDNEVSAEEELGSIFDEINEAEAAPEPEAAPADPIEAVPGEEVPSVPDAPDSWTADAKALWPNAAPELRDFILKRETDWQKTDGERAERLKGLESYEQALGPVMSHLRLNGVQPATYISQLVAADNYLRTDPAAAFQWLAKQYGYDLSQLNQRETDIDPALQPLLKQVNDIRDQFSGFMSQQQAAQQQQMLSLAEQFMTDPANVYAERLKDQILSEIVSVRSTQPNMQPGDVLRLAYDRAVKLSDEVQEEIRTEKAKAEAAKKAEEAKKKAAEARRMKTGNLSSKGTSGGETAQPKDLETELNDLYDRIQGAA